MTGDAMTVCLIAASFGLLACASAATADAPVVPRFGVLEQAFSAAGRHDNPYVELEATATFTDPAGATRTLPLFWDGGDVWRFRFSPDREGNWSWRVSSTDPGLDRRSGTFTVVASDLPGAIMARPDAPLHLQRQDGSPCYPVGDTCWPAMSDDLAKQLDRAAFEKYVQRRAAEGFNWIQIALLRRAGSNAGDPFTDLKAQTLNPAYFQECDQRIAFMQRRGITVVIFLTWGGRSDFTWNKFPDQPSRLRLARYVAARYSAGNVAFCASGEWNKWYEKNIDAKRNPGDDVRGLMREIGRAVRNADPHGRMIAMHVGSGIAVTREFADEAWMSFGDFQQNYWNLHAQILAARPINKPTVNAEYAYFLRDQNGDGRIDKNNSATLDDIRHATWDIAMAGGYAITGFGTTYSGGRRNPGPFEPDAAKNVPWETQFPLVARFFTSLPKWWLLKPADESIRAPQPVSEDVMDSPNKRTEDDYVRPPLTAYWALADAGRLHVAYMRGLTGPATLDLGASPAEAVFSLRRFDPRTGDSVALPPHRGGGAATLTPPDARDWLFVAQREP